MNKKDGSQRKRKSVTKPDGGRVTKCRRRVALLWREESPAAFLRTTNPSDSDVVD